MREELQFLSTREVAEMLGISTHTLTYWRSRRRGPRFYKHGGRTIRYKLQDVLQFIERRAVETEGQN